MPSLPCFPAPEAVASWFRRASARRPSIHRLPWGPSNHQRRRAPSGSRPRWGLAIVVAMLLASGLAPARAALPEHVPGEVLLRLKRTATTTEATSVLETLGGEIVEHPRARGLVHLRGTRLSVEDAIARYQRNALVEWIEPNYLWHATSTPNDPRFAEQWALHNTGLSGGTPGADIDAPLAWDRDTGSADVLVAVIDTGMDPDHPDLLPNRFTNSNEIPDNGVDDDGNGFIDDVHGWDFVEADAHPDDPHGHGTHCSGILGAAGNNGIGIAGVAWHVRILPARFLDASGVGSTTGAVDAIDYAVSMGARVLSNSWGGGPDSRALYEAIARAAEHEVLFVAAAGNDHRDNDVIPTYPSNYSTTLPNVVAVAATDDDDALASFSDWGATTVQVAAPGVDILSTWNHGQYQRLSGTSMATPHVSGALALALARYPGIGAQAARDLLMARCDPVPALAGRVASGGRLNLARLLSDPDTTPPGAIQDLVVTPSLVTNTVGLSWTSVGDDGDSGIADRYEIRYAPVPAATFDWNGATSAHRTPEPLPPGTMQHATVTELDFASVYTFEVRAVDEFGNFGLPSARVETRIVEPPILVASEDTLEFAMQSGQGEARPYLVENRGASNLELDVEIDRGPPPTTPMRVLVLHSGGNVSEIRGLLSNLPNVERVDSYDARLTTPTAAELRFYDVVLLVSTQPYRNNVAVGNAVADFVDAGGGVIASIGSFVTRTVIDGRFRSDGYLPFITTPELGSGSALGPYDHTHPIMQGVTEVTTAVHAFCEPAGEAKVVAWWRSGAPFVATLTRSVVGLNAYFGTVAAWDLEMPVVVWNALGWVRNSGNWLTTSRAHVSLPPGDSADLGLLCGASARVEGRYGATLRLRSNDPERRIVSTGAVLTVTGIPEFSLATGTLADDTLFVGHTRIDTLSVWNPGTGSLHVRARVDDPRFTLSFTEATLRAGERLPLTLTFRSDVEGRYSATVTVEPDGGLAPASASTTLWVVDSPHIDVALEPLDLTVDAGQHVRTEVALRNTGGAPLTLHMNIDGEPPVDTRPALHTASGDGDAPVISRGTPLSLDASLLGADGIPGVLRVGGSGAGGMDVGAGHRSSPPDAGDAAEAARVTASTAADANGDASLEDPVTHRPGPARESGPASSLVAAAPGSYPSPGLEVFGGRSLLFSGTVRLRGNSYQCTRDMTLHEHRFYLTTGVPTDLWFVVYEGEASVGVFRLISVSRIERSGVGEGWFSSGDVDVPLRARHHYLMLTQFRQPVRYWGKAGLYPYPIPSSFGALTAPVGFNWSPIATIPPDSLMDVPDRLYGPQVAYYQALVTGLPAPWLTVSPRTAVVPPDGVSTLVLDADLSDAVEGNLAARLALDSDDPDRPHVELPVRVRVRGFPTLALGREAFDLGDVILGESRAESLAVSNPGSATLEVSSITSADPALVVSPSTLRLGPREHATLSVGFRPSARGTVATSIELHSNDAARPTVRVAVTARVLPPPRIAVAPAAITAVVAPGTTGTAEVAIENGGESALQWSFVRGAAAVSPPTGLPLAHDLESVCANLTALGGEIERAIPARAEFPGGDSGDRIAGGLFLEGNFIFTDLSDLPLPYTGGRIEAGDSWFGPGTRYFTAKRPGLFLLVADLSGANVLTVEGQLITGATTVDQGAFELERYGVRWRALYQRAWGGPGPWVTRVVFTSGAAASQTPTDAPMHDLHEVTGLEGSSRVYALLFAHAPGTLVTADGLYSILGATLDAAGLPPPWLALNPGSGSIAAGARAVSRLSLDARQLGPGTYSASLAIASNVPNTSPVPVSLTMRVAETVAGRLSVTPRTLSPGGHGTPAKAVLDLPARVAATDLVAGSLRLAGLEPTIKSVQGSRVTLVVDRDALVRALPAGERVPVPMAADLSDGRVLRAADTIQVNRTPHPGNDVGDGDDLDAAVALADAVLAMPANPVRLPAALRFRLAQPSDVSVALYDAAGRRTRTLATGKWEAGTHTLTWDGRDDQGHPLSPGVYFLNLHAGTLTTTTRWVWLR